MMNLEEALGHIDLTMWLAHFQILHGAIFAFEHPQDPFAHMVMTGLPFYSLCTKTVLAADIPASSNQLPGVPKSANMKEAMGSQLCNTPMDQKSMKNHDPSHACVELSFKKNLQKQIPPKIHIDSCY